MAQNCISTQADKRNGDKPGQLKTTTLSRDGEGFPLPGTPLVAGAWRCGSVREGGCGLVSAIHSDPEDGCPESTRSSPVDRQSSPTPESR